MGRDPRIRTCRRGRAPVKVRPVSKVVRFPLAANLRGILLRRYKRFFADVEFENGSIVTVHCANSGSMKGCAIPGSAVRCSTSDNPKRKLRHTLEMIRIGRTWVGLRPILANNVVKRALEANIIPGLEGFQEIRSEVRADDRSRLDFYLQDRRDFSHRDRRAAPHRDKRAMWIEVKSATLGEGNLALFPDSVTERGRRHLEVLTDLHRAGDRAALVFLVQRADCDRVAPADEIDPDYGEALRSAVKEGVEVYALGARITARAITVERMLPVEL